VCELLKKYINASKCVIDLIIIFKIKSITHFLYFYFINFFLKKMTFDNALKVATAVAATEMASGSKRKRVSKGKESAEAGHVNKKSKKGFYINHKNEFLL